MDKVSEKQWKRRRRHLRGRRSINGTPERPRLAVHRTLQHMYAQVIDDVSGRTLCSASTVGSELKGTLQKKTGNIAASKKVGEIIARKAKEAGIKKVVFDRGGCLYHGRVKAVAEGAREGGLEF